MKEWKLFEIQCAITVEGTMLVRAPTDELAEKILIEKAMPFITCNGQELGIDLTSIEIIESFPVRYDT